MNIKLTITILVLAIILIIIGAMFKIMHWGFGEGALINGNTILAAGLALKVIALVLFVTRMLTAKRR